MRVNGCRELGHQWARAITTLFEIRMHLLTKSALLHSKASFQPYSGQAHKELLCLSREKVSCFCTGSLFVEFLSNVNVFPCRMVIHEVVAIHV